MVTSKITNKWSLGVIFSTAAATAVHLYLTQQHIITKYTFAESSSFCNINSFINCGTSIASSYSELAGIPLAIFGAVTQVTILFFFLRIFLSDNKKEQNKTWNTAFGLSLFSFTMSLVMAAVSLFVLKSLCPFCTLAYFLSFITLFSLYKFKNGPIDLFSSAQIKSLLIAFISLGALGFAVGTVTLHKYKSKDISEITDLRIQKWQSEAAKDIKVVDPQKYGPDSAKMKIVEFADFLCSHCKMAYPKLHTFANAHSDVQILFQTWPLDGCAGSETQPGMRCELAMASVCANQQSKGNEAQEYLFAMQEVFAGIADLKPELQIMYNKLGLNSQNMDLCMKNPETLKSVKAQIELGKSLGIEGTPTLFINGKIFQGGAHLPALEQLYKSL